VKRKYVLEGLPYHRAFAFVTDGKAEAVTFGKLIEYTTQALAAKGIEFSSRSRDPGGSLDYYLGRLSVEHGKIDGGRLERAWGNWERRYRDLQLNNPALELYDKLTWISEGHEGSSWPRGREQVLREWVEAGANPSNFPLDDRYDLLNPQFCRRLVHLRQVLGGWMYEDDVGNIEIR
jgi:hypothetical protein